jgi:hypothetical protein
MHGIACAVGFASDISSAELKWAFPVSWIDRDAVPPWHHARLVSII